jgi:hypothetical protein
MKHIISLVFVYFIAGCALPVQPDEESHELKEPNENVIPELPFEKGPCDKVAVTNVQLNDGRHVLIRMQLPCKGDISPGESTAEYIKRRDIDPVINEPVIGTK